MKCNPVSDQITVCGQELNYEPFLYLMLHKPQGVVTASVDDRKRTVMDLLPEQYRDRKLFPVGRLDKDTEGLLLITDDGQLAHRLLAPSRHVEKEYYVTVEGSLGRHEQEAFLRGITLADNSSCMAAELKILDQTEYDGQIRTNALVIIQEGKYHQIKRMFGVLNKPVLYLKRIRMGSLVLDDRLGPGMVRKLTEHERLSLEDLVR